MVPTEILDQWNDYRGRADQLEQLLDSLDTWKRWALGRDVIRERLSESAAVINHFADCSHGHELIEIVAAVDGWSHRAGVDTTAKALGPQGRSPGLTCDPRLEC